MLRRFFIAILCLLVLQFAIPAAAEFYEYVDAKGVTHFTDNVSTIPPQYRSQLESHHESINFPKKDTKNIPDTSLGFEGANKSGNNKAEKAAKADETEKLMAQRDTLMQQKQNLIQRYQDLQKEKEEIESTKGNMKLRRNAIRYNKRVKEMNEKIKQYKEQEKEFQDKLEKYNQAVNVLETRN